MRILTFTFALSAMMIPGISSANDEALQRLERGVYQMIKRDPARTVRSTLARLFADSPDGTLTEAQSRQKRLADQAKRRAQLLTQFLQFDLNGDGAIAATEIDEGLPSLDAQRKAELLALRYAADNDKNGTLSEAELAAHTDQLMRQRMHHLSPQNNLFQFDLDGDGTVTAEEVIGMVDLVMSSSDSEYSALMERHQEEARRANKSEMRRKAVLATGALEVCDFPEKSDGAEVQLLTISRGMALSTVALTGLEKETSIASLNIEDGETPLLLIVSAKYPVIWDIVGATHRIEHVVTHNANAVTGVPADKVSFVPFDDCIADKQNRRTDAHPRPHIDLFKAAFEQGRIWWGHPDRVGQLSWPSGQEMLNVEALKRSLPPFVSITSRMSEAEKTKHELNALRRQVAQVFPVGIREIAVDSLVAAVEPVPYPALPGAAGFAWLMETGHLRTGVRFLHFRPSYLVTKTIKALPRGRSLNQLPTLAVAKGVELDFTSGNLQFYTFFDAETGQCIQGAGCDVFNDRLQELKDDGMVIEAEQ